MEANRSLNSSFRRRIVVLPRHSRHRAVFHCGRNVLRRPFCRTNGHGSASNAVPSARARVCVFVMHVPSSSFLAVFFPCHATPCLHVCDISRGRKGSRIAFLSCFIFAPPLSAVPSSMHACQRLYITRVVCFGSLSSC